MDHNFLSFSIIILITLWIIVVMIMFALKDPFILKFYCIFCTHWLIRHMWEITIQCTLELERNSVSIPPIRVSDSYEGGFSTWTPSLEWDVSSEWQPLYSFTNHAHAIVRSFVSAYRVLRIILRKNKGNRKLRSSFHYSTQNDRKIITKTWIILRCTEVLRIL